MSNDNNENNKIRRKKVSSSASKNTTSKNSNTKSSRPKSSKKKDKFKIRRVSGIVFLAMLVFLSAAGTGLVFASLRDVQPVTKALLDEKTYQTTEIRYANGDLLSNAPSVNKKDPISIDQMPKDMINAIVSIEDERFYEHNGVDIKGLVRSVVNTLFGNQQGGSTIPMQVSKMLITSQEQSITRKIKDIYYAFEMNKTVSKEDILLAYLNNFYVGRGLYGAEAAAQGYFSKKAKELTAGEAALLMAATNNPSRFSPYTTEKLDGSETKEDVENKLLFYTNTTDDNFDEPTEVELQMINKLKEWQLISSETYSQLKEKTIVVRKAVPREAAKEKQKAILAKMLRLGYITQEEYDKEVAAPIEIKLSKEEETVVSSVEDYVYSEVIDSLMEQGYTKEEAQNMYYNGGLKIYTTIDSGMQKNLEEQYNNDTNFPGSRPGTDGIQQPQSAMVILDYRTGQIKSLIGGRYVKGKRTLNRATTAKQPGSTIKPLSVYTPAIDTLEITQSTAFSDARGGYKFEKNQKWNPKTTTSGSGTMSVRKALAMSSNTIAIKVAERLGDSYSESVDVMIDYLKNFGITTLLDSKTKEESYTDRYFPSLVLGGMAYGISPLEMAAAYGTIANGGTYIEPTVFTTITTYDNNLLVKANPQENRVISEDVAYVITDMLQAVVKEGTGKAAAISNMAVAGKTGTTNDALDCWFVGYTPYYVGATYIGDDAGTGEARRSVTGTSGTAAALWSKVMTPIHKNLTRVEKFTAPDGVYFTKINPIDGGTSSYGVSAAFIDGTYPSRVSTQAPPVQQQTEEEEPATDNAGDGDNPPEEDNTESPEETTPSEDTGQTPNDNNHTGNTGNNGNTGNTGNTGNNPVDTPTDGTAQNAE